MHVDTPSAASSAELRAARLLQGRTKADVAAGTGLHWRTISRLEAGRPAVAETVMRVRRFLGLEVGDQPMAQDLEDRRIGRALRERRYAEDLSLTAVAVFLDLHPSALSRIERGHGPPRRGWSEFLADDDLARALGFARAAELMAHVGYADALPTWNPDAAPVCRRRSRPGAVATRAMEDHEDSPS